MAMIATVFDPGDDGKIVQKMRPNGKPLEYPADRENRALLSAQKAWWPIGAAGKFRADDPEWGLAPEGAEIHLDGRPKWKMELLPVFDAEGELTGTKYDWVDIVQRERNRVAAERLERIKARLTNQRIAPVVVETTEPAYRDTVADPLATADGQPVGSDVVEVKTIEVVEPVAEAHPTRTAIAKDEAVLTEKAVATVGGETFRTDDRGVTWRAEEPTPAKPRKVR